MSNHQYNTGNGLGSGLAASGYAQQGQIPLPPQPGQIFNELANLQDAIQDLELELNSLVSILSPISVPVPSNQSGPASPATTVSPVADRLRQNRSQVQDLATLVRTIKSVIDL